MLRFPTYGNLVKNENDLIGLIAYSLYKQDKLAFVEDHRIAAGAEPDDAHMETFCRSSNLPNRLASYRESAASLLEQLHRETLEATIEDIKREYQSELENHVKKIREPSMSRNILEHAVAGFVVTSGVALLILVGLVTKNGLAQTASGLFGIKIEMPHSSPTD